ncbi:hypothetical protein H0H81_003682 [Sphagnurus paluster]|uniref:BZIP domain-containing protein n=1 Tax=Sphagnurus paluster TaxID=117069 RepID=A0A9P7K4A0_9AGAR|nr:hypothetical protein H0H81_003682 [Sphagnurus paluster]
MVMSSVTNHSIHSERPERSRNAKAQARHRAKRKAYIEQLESTVTKLQTTLGFTHEDVAALPPPLVRIRELEQENTRLEKENEELRRMLSDAGGRVPPLMEMSRRNSLSSFQDVRVSDREYKRKKMIGDVEGTYMVKRFFLSTLHMDPYMFQRFQSPSDTPPHGDHIRPPPLTIPQPISNHYTYGPTNQHTNGGQSMPFNIHAPAFQMPNTPSGSSATSSPPFSVRIFSISAKAAFQQRECRRDLFNDVLFLQPALMQEPLHSSANHRPPSISGPQHITNYTPRGNHYVKVEEDHYAVRSSLFAGSAQSARHDRKSDQYLQKNRRREYLLSCVGSCETDTGRTLFELGNSILCRVDGPHFTFVDPRKHNDIGAMVRAARRLVSLFEEKGVQRAKVVVSVSLHVPGLIPEIVLQRIPATIEGLRAAQDLEREHGIHTNLYFVSGLLHAAACAEAGATTITIPVGRLLGWYEGRRRTTYEDLSLHPGVETIQSTLEYFKLHELKSKLVGSDFRSISEIPPLLGFDAVSLSTAQIASVRRLQFAPAAVRPSSAVNLRAEQAQFPTSLLSAKASFMEAMSSETRSMVAATLFGPLDELKAYMDGLEAVITYELGRQFELVTVDLKTLYDTSRKGEKAAEEAEEREEPGALRSKRSLAKDLGVEVVPVTQHNDEEVF